MKLSPPLKRSFNFTFLALFLLLLIGNGSEAVGGKRGIIDLGGGESDRSLPQKKHQPAAIHIPQKHKVTSSQPQPNNARESGPAFRVIRQDRKDEYRSSQEIPFSQPARTPQSSFSFIPPVPVSLPNDDEVFNDPTFLASLQKIEDDYKSSQEGSSFQVQKMSQTNPRLIPLALASLPNEDDIFYDPAFLASVDEVESAYLSQEYSQSSQKDLSDEINTKLLNTFESHQDHLFTSMKKAKKSILITSHTFSANLKSQRNLFEALRQASLRNVKVYLYFNKDYGLNGEEIDFLEETGIKLSNPTVHSKLLIIDKNLITCGSFDWLSDTAYTQSNKEASIVLEGKDLDPFIQDIWETLKKYNRLSYHPNTQDRIERNFRELPSQVLADDTTHEEYELLTTPHQHDEFFLDCLETAKHNITMCSPFITRDRKHLEFIFPKDTLKNFLKVRKTLHIFYRANDENIKFLRQHLAGLTVPNLILSPVNNLHRKTLIVDEAYVEGSFNWLSSARTLEDEYFLMETSFILKGPKAKTFIDAFYRAMR